MAGLGGGDRSSEGDGALQTFTSDTRSSSAGTRLHRHSAGSAVQLAAIGHAYCNRRPWHLALHHRVIAAMADQLESVLHEDAADFAT